MLSLRYRPRYPPLRRSQNPNRVLLAKVVVLPPVATTFLGWLPDTPRSDPCVVRSGGRTIQYSLIEKQANNSCSKSEDIFHGHTYT